MGPFRIQFDSMSWDEARPGVRQKVYREGSRQIRLVEFSTSEGFSHWCETGHIGFVLAGGLEISFNGNAVSFVAGDGLFIPSGAESAHRAVSIVPGTRLLMIEEI